MERHVKERLIGAAVLVAAAVILIPEMLSGRAEPEGEPARVTTAGDTPLKTYTIDLSKSGTRSPAPESESMSTSAPPPETTPAVETARAAEAPTAQAIPESTVAQPSSAVPSPAPETRTSSPPQASTRPVPVQPAPAPVTTRPAAPEQSTSAGWAVQLGSFSSRATADNLAGKLRGEGYDAFVMPVKSGANTLYRVRIGPMADRDAATRVLGKVKTTVPAAAVVKHP